MNRQSNVARLIALLLIPCVLNLTGCYYYTYNRDNNPTIEKIDKLKDSPNYIIVHDGDLAYHLTNVKVNQDEKTISGITVTLPADHMMYLKTNPVPGTATRYKKIKGVGASPGVINEVHFYLKDMSVANETEITIPLTAIEKIDVYDPDTGATTASFIVGGIGIAAGVFTIILIIAILTKSSCPFVYIQDGDEYVFAGEIFGGAIFKCTERDDYLLLPHVQEREQVEIKVANKLKERQFINQLEVVSVMHPENTKVIPDRFGTIHHIQQPLELLSASVNDNDITAALRDRDGGCFYFNSEEGENYFNDVVLTFPKPSGAGEGHLWLNAKNSYFGDYVFGEFTKLFGSKYTSWIEKQNNSPREQHMSWAVDQGLKMKVYVEENGEWIARDTVEMPGPLGFRDMVVALDLSKVQSETVRIKLSAAFMMWDLDYAAIDYSDDTNMVIDKLQASSAVANGKDNEMAALLSNDSEYVVQGRTGDELTVKYPVARQATAGYKIDYVLHARGYYQHVRDYEGMPQITQLLDFRNPGRFSQFSKEKYDEMSRIMEMTTISATTKQVRDEN